MKKIELPKLDVTKYVGTKTQIAKAEIINSKFGKAIKIETDSIDLKDGDTLPEGKQLRASIILGLVELTDGSLSVGIDSKTDKFLKEHKINLNNIPDDVKVGDLLKVFDGLSVVCQKSEKGFLTIA